MYASPIRLVPLLASIEAGTTTPRRAIDSALERIADVDPHLHAFARLAPAESLERQAEATGPLAGIPIGIKDIFDTADMVTEHGSPIYAGHRPRADAALVSMARAAGATIVGKTVTTEFASLDPAATRNPHNPDHTPGGSSSGSAAAVAAGMVTGASGSQTAGSIIRPASFCGIAGFKPSFRLIPTVGMKTFSWSLDTAGLFAATVEDVALLAELLTRRDLSARGLADAAGITVGLYRSAVDEQIEPVMIDAWRRGAHALQQAGARIVDVGEPETLAAGRDIQPVIQNFEAAHALMYEHRGHRAQLGDKLLAILDAGAEITPEAYDGARRTARAARRSATSLFGDVDVLLLPSAFGPAPRTLASTGDPMLNKLWTLTGNPCVSVPGLRSPDGMPLGLTVVARFGRDALALAIGSLLENLIPRD